MPIRTGRKLRKENSNSESKHGREKAKPLQKKKKMTRATNTQTDKQTNKQTNKQTDKQTDRQTNRQTNKRSESSTMRKNH